MHFHLYGHFPHRLTPKVLLKVGGQALLHHHMQATGGVHEQITEWVGGYFDYEKGTAANKWFSAIKTWEGPVTLGSPQHPISRGVKPFSVKEEFYFNLRFRENDDRVKPIIVTRPPGDSKDYVVGYAVERQDGGRGFGFTGGHFYENWWIEDFRRTMLNAIVWTAGVDVPEGGVASVLDEPIRLLIVTGHNHPAHDWRKSTAALIKPTAEAKHVELRTEVPERATKSCSCSISSPSRA